MSGETNIRWSKYTWNPVSGCLKISDGCTHCYAYTLAESRRGSPAFPVGFDPVMKPHKLRDPYKWREPADIFVNSMSDLFLGAWTRDFIDQVHDVMLDCRRHVFIILTKRPRRMTAYYLGPDGYLARRSLGELPENIWPGTTIESDLFCWRAEEIKRIPHAGALTISAEPLLTPLPSLDLAGLGWLIVGGESGTPRREMDDDWARDLRDRAAGAGVPYFFKQHSHHFTERGIELDGERIEQRPPNTRFGWQPGDPEPWLVKPQAVLL